MINIYIADDHELVLEGLVALLNQPQFNIVGTATDGLQVINWRESESADVLLLDISMPFYNGLAVLDHFKQNQVLQKTIIISSYNDFHFINKSIENGAKGYILKQEDITCISTAIETVHNGGKFFSNAVMQTILGKNAQTKESKQEKKYVLESLISQEELSPKEKEVLSLLAQNYNANEIAQTINISPSSVRTYTSRMREKLNFIDTYQLKQYALATINN